MCSAHISSLLGPPRGFVGSLVFQYLPHIMKIQDKVVIVTGASEGIGKATALALSRGGAKLVLAARSEDKIKALAASLPGAIAIRADMRVAADVGALVEAAIRAHGRIDILVNNAGQGMYGPVEDIDLEQYKAVMELNVYAPLRAMQLVVPIMRKAGGGMIVNISSMVSKNAYPSLGAYASSKYALNALSFTARAELAKDKIVVSVFHPKMTATRFGENAIGARPGYSGGAGSGAPSVDKPEQVAERILELIKSEAAEANM
jgi:short-subunit dehydrogenase